MPYWAGVRALCGIPRPSAVPPRAIAAACAAAARPPPAGPRGTTLARGSSPVWHTRSSQWTTLGSRSTKISIGSDSAPPAPASCPWSRSCSASRPWLGLVLGLGLGLGLAQKAEPNCLASSTVLVGMADLDQLRQHGVRRALAKRRRRRRERRGTDLGPRQRRPPLIRAGARAGRRPGRGARDAVRTVAPPAVRPALTFPPGSEARPLSRPRPRLRLRPRLGPRPRPGLALMHAGSKAAQPSASGLSGGSSQRQFMPQAATRSGQPW
eukprot:scaffold26548_cov55-Phaeocystis_antarctica.AAC.3